MNKNTIYITGDTHNMMDWKKLNTTNFPFQKHMTKDDLVIITGDAGIVWDLGEQDEYIQAEYSKRNFTTAFVDGNHDNHDALDSYPVEMWNGGKIHRINESIIHLMRGQVYTIDGKNLFTMGGAASTDKSWRKEGESWWAREMPSPEEYEEAINNLRKHDFRVDIVITHCAPEGVIGLARDENELTLFFDSLIKDYNFKFRKWFCGHYHIDKSFGNVEVIYEKVFNLNCHFDHFYDDDTIFLLTISEYEKYEKDNDKEMALTNNRWWLHAPDDTNNEMFNFYRHEIYYEGYLLDGDFVAYRPALRYSSLKSRIIKSTVYEDRFIFNDYPFRIIDPEKEIAIAEAPVAIDIARDDASFANVKKQLNKWLDTGIWDYELGGTL